MTKPLQLVPLLALAFAFACKQAPPAPPAPAVWVEAHPAAPVAEVEPPPAPGDRSGPLEIEFGYRLLKPSAFPPHLSGGSGPTEPDKVGWSRNSDEFIVCYPDSSECYPCDFHRLGAKPEHVLFGDAVDQTEFGEEKICDQPQSALERRLAVGDFRIEDGNWAYGADVVLVVSEDRGESDDDGTKRGVVQIGARLRGDWADTAVASIDRVEECSEGYCYSDVHIDGIAPSPDGQTIAVLVHASEGEGTDTYPVRLLDARTLAHAVQNAS